MQVSQFMKKAHAMLLNKFSLYVTYKSDTMYDITGMPHIHIYALETKRPQSKLSNKAEHSKYATIRVILADKSLITQKYLNDWKWWNKYRLTCPHEKYLIRTVFTIRSSTGALKCLIYTKNVLDILSVSHITSFSSVLIKNCFCTWRESCGITPQSQPNKRSYH